MNKKEAMQAEARKTLLDVYIKPTTKLLIIIKSVSASGMQRRMKVLTDEFQDITYLVADLCNLSVNEKGLKINGCGMDVTFWLAQYITDCLYGKNKSKKFSGNNGTCLDWRSV